MPCNDPIHDWNTGPSAAEVARDKKFKDEAAESRAEFRNFIRETADISREKTVLGHLVSAWEEWLKLSVKHPDEDHEFRTAIHNLQCMLAWRVARRVDPETWGNVEKK